MCNILHSEIFWIALTAVASCASVFVAIRLVKKQSEFSERDLHLRMLITLENRFNSIEIRKARKNLAKQILRGTDKSELWETTLEFFELLGIMFRKKSLDPEMVWATFSYYNLRWWELTKELVNNLRQSKNDITFYAEFENLTNEMYKWDMMKRNKTLEEVTPKKEELDEFLNEEGNLE